MSETPDLAGLYDGQLDAVLEAYAQAKLREVLLLETVEGPPLDDVLLAFQRFSPPRPAILTPIKFTVRERIRIWRYHKRRDVEQWIHDHLPNAVCDC